MIKERELEKQKTLVPVAFLAFKAQDSISNVDRDILNIRLKQSSL
jgi:hypothetical protein